MPLNDAQKEFASALATALAETQGASNTAVIAALEKLHAQFNLPGPGPGEFRSWSEKAAKELVALKYQSGNSVRVPIELPGFGLKPGDRVAPMEALVGKDVTSSQFPAPRTTLPFVPFPFRRIRVRDLLPVAGIGTPVVEYARVTGFSNNAAVTPEGAQKPQSEITTTKETETAKTIATFMPVSRQALTDVGGLRAWLDQVVESFVMDEEDDQILNGVGPGDDHLNGILNDANIQSQAVGAEASPATPKLIAIRKAITKVQTAFTTRGGDPNGLVIHPSDAEDLDLLTDTTGRYLLLPDGSPANAEGARNVWGLRVVVTPAIAAGTGLVGDFALGAALYIYEGMSIQITDGYEDYFRRNLLALRAEQRELLTRPFPSYFCKVTGL